VYLIALAVVHEPPVALIVPVMVVELTTVAVSLSLGVNGDLAEAEPSGTTWRWENSLVNVYLP